MDNKKFTPAQQSHLRELIIGRNAAQQAVDAFVIYLRNEHTCPETEGWIVPNDLTGFVKQAEKADAEV